MDIATIEMLIARGENLPVLPEVVSAVFRITEDPKCTAVDLERLIEEDSALTAKILRVVNSALYGVSTVNTTGRAVAVLGTSRVRTLITSIALQNLVAERRQASRFKKLAFWRHSLATATAARMIAKIKDPLHIEELYVAGILHDIGLLLMDKYCPNQLDTVIRCAESEGVSIVEAEQKNLPFTHAELGGILARRWGLGEFMADAVERHHEPFSLIGSETPGAILGVADAIAHRTGFTNQLSPHACELNEDLLSCTELSCGRLEQMGVVIRQEVEKAESIFATVLSPSRPMAS